MRRPILLDAYGRPARRASVPSSPYHGAARGPRFAGVYAPGNGPNSVLFGSIRALRDRIRERIRNDAFVRKGLNMLVANLVGTGITPHSLVKDEKLRDAIEAAWLISTDELPVMERDAYAQQAAAVRAYLADGECFVRRRPRDASDGLYVPIQMQLLEADHCPLEMNETRRNGNTICAGKERNAFGKLEAIHLYRNHPADGLFGSSANVEIVRVPASEVEHLYDPTLRPGSERGEPSFASVILSSIASGDYDDATQQLMVIGSCLTVIRTRALVDSDEADELQSETEDALELGPGLVVDGDPGDTFETVSPPSVGATYPDFKREMHLRRCAGMNVTLEDGTGDHGDATFSSMKGADRQFQRWAQQQIYNVICPGYARFVWSSWMDAAVAAGVLRLPGYASRWREYQALEWRPQGITPLQPREETAADIDQINACLESPQAIIRKKGEDPRRVRREIEEENEWRKAQGLPLVGQLPAPAVIAEQTPEKSPNQQRRERNAARRAHA